MIRRSPAPQADGTFALEFTNTGRATAVFEARSGRSSEPPPTYTVEPGKALADVWHGSGGYDLSVYGPNGFFRSYRGGGVGAGESRLDVRGRYERGGDLVLVIANLGAERREISVAERNGGTRRTRTLVRERWVEPWDGRRRSGWYDLVVTVPRDPAFQVELAGHVETGEDGWTDPGIGAAGGAR